MPTGFNPNNVCIYASIYCSLMLHQFSTNLLKTSIRGEEGAAEYEYFINLGSMFFTYSVAKPLRFGYL